MMPTGNSQDGKRPRGPRAGFQFLKVIQLTREWQRFKILAVKTEDTGQFNDIIFKIGLNGNIHLLGFRANDPNYQLMLATCGEDENNYLNREFLVRAAVDDFSGVNRLQIGIPDGNSSTTAAPAAAPAQQARKK